MATEISTARIVVRLMIGIVVMSAAFFGSAGTFDWPEAWLYMIFQFSFSAAFAVWLKKNNPDLLKDRMTFLKSSARGWDKAILWISTVVFIPYLFLPGLDAIRYQWSSVPLFVKVFGFIGIVANLLLISWVMRENTYLSRVVEIQKERGHRVITTGPYQYIRHPMYVGVIILFFCIPLALGSLLTLIPGTLLTALIVIRTHFEDKTLRSELEGYKAYSQRVTYRLVPGIW
ncbi:MAG: isoprenylcysteine carboxylmethyltransferase family protein [Desulfobacterales bacterium]|nr:MAG: isoprenylcysteine carboxylmethyltransferase family protein [Desulfobacterales bacterium]